MLHVLILCQSLAAVIPDGSSASLTGDSAVYREAREQAGRDPEAQVRLALWCEARGLSAERAEHLAAALRADPAHARARGLLGQVAYRGRWLGPDEAVASAQSDDDLRAKLAEYDALRAAMAETPDGHWFLALWCERVGLKPESVAHFTAVTRLAPERADARVRLGCRKYGGRWLTEPAIAAERVEVEARKRADREWSPRLGAWWAACLADPDRGAAAEQALARSLDPRAIPAIRKLFSAGTPEQQSAAVRLLAQIDAPEASTELARLAGLGRSDEVRAEATRALVPRDPREFFDMLLDLVRPSLQVTLAPGPAAGAVATLNVEDERLIVRKSYVERLVPVVAGPAQPNPFAFIAPAMSKRPPRSATATARQELNKDLRVVEGRNESRARVRSAVIDTLTAVSGQDLGPDPDAWKAWWTDQKGYSYAPAAPTIKRTVNRVYVHEQAVVVRPPGTRHSCFAAGTLVATLSGRRPIEALKVGDRVLAEDVGSGALSYQPIVAVFHNPPHATLALRLGDELIQATPIHRFWKAGAGWVMARDLKPGDTVRTLGGLVRLTTVEPADVQPVFNLEVTDGHSFFVGRDGILVHDHSLVQPVSRPFDAPPALPVAIARRAD